MGHLPSAALAARVSRGYGRSQGRRFVTVSGETRVVGPYRLMDILGRGGMGVVHRAVHVDSGAVVALKTVTAMRGRQLAGLRAEIRSLARLDHPGIVRIVDDGAEDGSPWFAMELIEGRTLADHLDALWERNRRGDAATLRPRRIAILSMRSGSATS